MRVANFRIAGFVALIFFIAMWLSACGGNAGSSNNNPVPPATGSGGNGSGSGGSGGSGSGGGGSSAPTTQWSSTMDRFVSSQPGTATGSGQVTVDTAGNVTLQFSGGTANTSYNAQFCPYPFVAPPNQCFSLATITSDGNGEGKLTMKFPHSGAWSGNFYITSSSDYFNTSDANQHGQASMLLVPASGVSGNPPSPMAQDPLSSGTVTMSNASVTVTVKGATANATYTVTQYTNATQSSDMASLVTDGNGNGSVTFATVNLPAPDISVERRSNGQAVASGFVSGFKVP
jgi:hypothetical protein